MKVYVIRDWEKTYEISQSKRIPDGKPLSYVPMPTKQDGKGLRRILRSENALSVFGVWCLVVELAAKMPRRGVLADADGPFDVEDIADSIGIDPKPVEELLKLVTGGKINWIEFIEWQNDLHSPRIKGGFSVDAPSEVGAQADEKRREEKRREDISSKSHSPDGDGPPAGEGNTGSEPKPEDSEGAPQVKNGGGKWTKAKLEKAEYADYPGFVSWWKAYPRTDGKRAAFEAWLKRDLEDQTPSMLAALAKKKKCSSWIEEGGKYVPHGATYLNKRMEDDEPEVSGPVQDANVRRFRHG